MEGFTKFIGDISNFIWGIPIMVILIGGGVFLTVRLGFFQFRYFPQTMPHPW